MTEPADIEARLSRVERRAEEAVADAAAARHLASATDRDVADLGVKVDADRQAINALGLQVAGRFDALEERVDRGFAAAAREFEQIDRNFLAVGTRLDQVAVGQRHIVDLLDTIIARGEDS